MTFKIEDIVVGSPWVGMNNEGEIEIKYNKKNGIISYFYIDQPKRCYDTSLKGLLDYFEPKKCTGNIKLNLEAIIPKGSSWIKDELKVEIDCVDGFKVCFYDENGDYGELDFSRFLVGYKPCKDKVKEFQIKPTSKKVSDLLNGTTVVVIHTEGWREGAETTTVRYELADFMDDEPPFMEILFVDKYDNVVYFTEDMNEPVYDLEGLYIVKGVVK